MNPCTACDKGTMQGPFPGVLANGERCDTCGIFSTDQEAAAEMAKRLTDIGNLAALYASNAVCASHGDPDRKWHYLQDARNYSAIATIVENHPKPETLFR